MDWVQHAHRGMRLRPTETAISLRVIKPGTYTFCSWVERFTTVEVERLGTKKRKTVKIEHLEQE